MRTHGACASRPGLPPYGQVPVERGAAEAERQAAHVVFHQGDERRDDDGERLVRFGQHQRRQLEAQRLARAYSQRGPQQRQTPTVSSESADSRCFQIARTSAQQQQRRLAVQHATNGLHLACPLAACTPLPAAALGLGCGQCAEGGMRHTGTEAREPRQAPQRVGQVHRRGSGRLRAVGIRTRRPPRHDVTDLAASSMQPHDKKTAQSRLRTAPRRPPTPDVRGPYGCRSAGGSSSGTAAAVAGVIVGARACSVVAASASWVSAAGRRAAAPRNTVLRVCFELCLFSSPHSVHPTYGRARQYWFRQL